MRRAGSADAVTNLVAPSSSFVGRRAELEALQQILERGARLVTVTGPAGVGKTRLASLLASHWLMAAEGREAWLCRLEIARDLAGVCVAVASATGEHLGKTDDAAELTAELGTLLAARGEQLLILDAAEHVLAETAKVAERWLLLAPATTLLITTRERLRVEGEHVVELEPLPTEHALQLWCDRATAARPGYQLQQRATVRDLVAMLDHNPLAIELAAARMSLLAESELVARWCTDREALGRGRRDQGNRHATLEAAIAWSWTLLDDHERSTLMDCSVFVGDFDVEAVEAVVRDAHQQGDGGVLDWVQALLDKHLLVARLDERGGRRLALYQTVRAFSAQKLREEGAEAAALERHTHHYLALGARLADQARQGDDEAALDRLGLERSNLLAVYERSRTDRPDDAFHALGALEPLLWARGPLGRLAEALQLLLQAPALAAALRARALEALGRVRFSQGRIAEAVGRLQAALAAARDGGDLDLEATVELRLGQCETQRDLSRARSHYLRALELFEQLDDRRRAATVSIELGAVLVDMQRLAEGRACVESALRVFRDVGDQQYAAVALHALASITRDLGLDDEAQEQLEEALRLAGAVGSARLDARLEAEMGLVEHVRGDLPGALRRYRRALEVLSRLGLRRMQARTSGWLGVLHHELGELGRARHGYQQALSLLDEDATRYRTLFGGFLAALDADEDLVSAAPLPCDDGKIRALGPVLQATHALQRGHGLLSALRAEARRGPCPHHAQRLESLRRWSEDVIAQSPAPELVRTATEVRLAARLLRASLARSTGLDLTTPRPTTPLLTAEADGAWWRLDGGEAVEVRSVASRRLLAHLLRTRLDEPNEAASIVELVAAAWPDQKLLPEAARNRLGVALSALRKAGLKPFLLKRGEGYLLDAALEVVVVRGPPLRR